MLDLAIKQKKYEQSSEGALESFKAALVDVLNNSAEDRHVENRWSISQIAASDQSATLIYDQKILASVKIENGELRITAQESELARYDDIIYAIRYVASHLDLAVYSYAHNKARLPQNSLLALDHTFFKRNTLFAEFFAQSEYIPRYALEGYENTSDGVTVAKIYPPFYAESKTDGSIHILNPDMLSYLVEKENKQTNSEFSYKIATNLDEFARKYDFKIVPVDFYQCYGLSSKIINSTYFDVFHIRRKVFIDPYVWDFDSDYDHKYYQNVKNGMHFMDKVRKDEDLNGALKRVLTEELKVADDYVGAHVRQIDFDRDRDGILTPRLKINVFVHGLVQKHASQTHDWVSIK